MRKLYVLAVIAGLLAPLVAPAPPSVYAGDFDPSGRNRKKPGGGKKPGGTKPGGTKPSGTKPSGTKPDGAKPDGTKPNGTKPDGTKPDGANTKPGDDKPGDDKGKNPEVLIARYMGIVLNQPAAPFPLQRLAQLYRERDGNLKKLVSELEAKSAGTGDDAWPAKVALAGILKQDGRYDEAIKTYEAAISDKPKESAPLMALAQLEADRGDKKAARGSYEKALALLTQAADVEQTTRTLMQLCLDLKDFDAAKAHHASLVKKAQGSLFVKAELGREMMARQQYELAEGEFRELVKASAGDNRALAPALRDLGSVLAKEKKMSEALETLKKALAIAGSAAGIRAEIHAIMADAYRAEGKLTELVEILEKEQGQDFHRIATLGALYEETGNVDKALAAYRKALAVDGQHVDTRVKIVHLLQTAGQLEEAIKEYEALVRAAPNNPDFVFELCETLIQRGDRPKALKLLKELESRAQENDVLAAVADFYERVEEKDRAMAVLSRLANGAGSDPTFLIDLGDRHFQAGDKKRALDTWAKIKTVVPNRAKSSSTLGQVYLDHDMADEALAALREAVTLEPASVPFKKALAVALERTAPGTPFMNDRFNEAVGIWEELLRGAKNEVNLSREARTHIVSIWSVQKELSNRVAPLKQRFEAAPPDLEAGRLLAEVQRKLGKLSDAEGTLRGIVDKDKGDEASLLALERVLVQEQNLPGAIEVLQKLAERNDKAARQYYQRMAQYAAELYKDDDAIKYAAKAVELSPEDALGHQKLGDMYRKRQDNEKAVAEYRQAIAKNDRLFAVYFDLAELLLSSGDVAEADRLFRRVMRASPDEELLARATRMSVQINLGKGSLESLERELLPVAVGNPQKPIYRRLLIEIYGAMTLPLVQKVKNGENAKEVADAKRELSAIGARALKPLLDALGDDRESQQRVAIEVLAYVENKSAGPTLFNFATGTADKDLRTRAMIAVGALRDPGMLPRFEQLLAPKERDSSVLPSDELALSAAWGVAKIRDGKAEELLEKLLSSASPDVRAIASVGLGLSKNKKHGARLLKLAKELENGPSARAAAVLSLGYLVESGGLAQSRELGDLLAQNLDASDGLMRRAALATSARVANAGKPAANKAQESRLGALPTVTQDALAQGVLSGDAALREDAIASTAALLSRDFGDGNDPLSVPEGKLDTRKILAGLFPLRPTSAGRTAVLIELAPLLAKGSVSAIATSPEKAATIADCLISGPVLGPFAKAAGEVDPAQRAQAEAATRTILEASIPGFAKLVSHPDAAVRTKAAHVLALSKQKSAHQALAAALRDGDEELRRAILGTRFDDEDGDLSAAVAELALSDKSWAVRVRAAEALGTIGARADKSKPTAALTKIASSDGYALVREAALVSLAALDGAAAAPVLREAAKNDKEDRVRATAARLLAPPAPPPAPAPPAPSAPAASKP